MSRDAQIIDELDVALVGLRSALRKLRAGEDWIDQHHSPLGKRRHLAAARKGEIRGHRVGHLVLVQREEIDAYIRRHAPASKRPASDVDTRDQSERVAELLAEEAPKPRKRRSAA